MQMLVERPAHVPAERVVDFDYFSPAGMAEGEDVYVALKRLHDKPDILWTPRNGGHWIVTRAEDVRWVRDEPVLFSRTEFIIPRGMMNTLMPPVNVDPPYHARFRAVLNPAFTPGAIRGLTAKARAIAADLIARLKPKGCCEFVSEFGRIMPIQLYLEMLELPTDEGWRQEFLNWTQDYLRAQEQAAKDRAIARIAAYLSEVIDQRAANPGGDVFSRIAAWRTNPRYANEEEVIGMAMTTFLGGLDTVIAMMCFTVRHLASHPQSRKRLITEPAIIPRAAEEYLRRHGLAQTGRVLTKDVTRGGVTMKRDDMLLVVDPLAALDERIYSNPMEVDFDRDTSVHDSFGNGVHRCLGEHLARMELIVFIEEWLKHIPDFRLDPDLPSVTHAGTSLGMSQLGLRWD
jgi:cytochrome P450